MNISNHNFCGRAGSRHPILAQALDLPALSCARRAQRVGAGRELGRGGGGLMPNWAKRRCRWNHCYCLTQPPTKSCWIATTRRHVTSKTSGTGGGVKGAVAPREGQGERAGVTPQLSPRQRSAARRGTNIPAVPGSPHRGRRGLKALTYPHYLAPGGGVGQGSCNIFARTPSASEHTTIG